MKFPVFLLRVSMVLVTLSGLCPGARADFAWTEDMSWARMQARAANKPILVDVYTDWCGWCHKLDQNVYPDPLVQRAARDFVMVRLNAEGNGQDVAEKYQVTGYPTLLFLEPDGRYLSRIAGYLAAPDLARYMNDIVASRTAPAPQVAQPTNEALPAAPQPAGPVVDAATGSAPPPANAAAPARTAPMAASRTVIGTTPRASTGGVLLASPTWGNVDTLVARAAHGANPGIMVLDDADNSGPAKAAPGSTVKSQLAAAGSKPLPAKAAVKAPAPVASPFFSAPRRVKVAPGSPAPSNPSAPLGIMVLQ